MSDPEGKKLVIGTKTLNALVTSSLRIDASHMASVGGTTINFDLDNGSSLTTATFLDADSIRKANTLAGDQRTDKIDRFDLFHQLRQLRSKFLHPSTYTLCRSSSVFANDHRSRPYTIFSYADYDSGEQESAAKIASQLFREIATSVMSQKNDPLVPKQLVHTHWLKCPDGQVKSALNENYSVACGRRNQNSGQQIARPETTRLGQITIVLYRSSQQIRGPNYTSQFPAQNVIPSPHLPSIIKNAIFYLPHSTAIWLYP